MGNLSQTRRAEMLEYLNHLKEIHTDDESRIALAKIETALTEKKYGLVWEEHEEEVDKQLVHNIPVFREIEDKKIVVDENADFNFLLEGDNLHSLKLLEKTHKGKVDVIYIDPPYNTKNKEFIYNDTRIGEDDTYRHSKWLSFMNERLKIAKELLSYEGVIFISIDENEFAQLKLLCDSILGEQNYIENFIWIKNSTKNLSKTTSTNHEYILVYANNINTIANLQLFRKNKEGYKEVIHLINESIKNDKTPEEAQKELRKFFKQHKELKGISMYNNIDKSWNIYRLSDSSAPKSTGKAHIYDVYHPITGKICKVPSRGWAYTEETMKEHIKNHRIAFGKDETTIPQFKRYLTNVQTEVRKSVITDFTDGKKELKRIFGDAPFDNAKPTTLIKDILSTFGKDLIVLDYFAGSGTTGQAVMQLNKENGGNRKYILCTNNENNICEKITYQRMKNIQKELPHNLKYYKTEFIPKLSEDEEILSSKLLDYIKEMVELENMCEIDGNSRRIILSDEDLNNALTEMEESGVLYIPSFILLTNEIKDVIEERKLEVVTIPDYYFTEELREVNEL